MQDQHLLDHASPLPGKYAFHLKSWVVGAAWLGGKIRLWEITNFVFWICDSTPLLFFDFFHRNFFIQKQKQKKRQQQQKEWKKEKAKYLLFTNLSQLRVSNIGETVKVRLHLVSSSSFHRVHVHISKLSINHTNISSVLEEKKIQCQEKKLKNFSLAKDKLQRMMDLEHESKPRKKRRKEKKKKRKKEKKKKRKKEKKKKRKKEKKKKRKKEKKKKRKKEKKKKRKKEKKKKRKKKKKEKIKKKKKKR